jgi:tRNA (adenine37-N6)-methyltransferase
MFKTSVAVNFVASAFVCAHYAALLLEKLAKKKKKKKKKLDIDTNVCDDDDVVSDDMLKRKKKKKREMKTRATTTTTIGEEEEEEEEGSFDAFDVDENIVIKRKLKELEDRHKHERNAVIRLQHQLRQRHIEVTKYEDAQQFGPSIAIARSCFSRRAGTPRQGGGLVASARCLLKFDVEKFVPRRAIEGLGEFSHVWVIYVFHANTNMAGTKNGGAVKALVQVPRLNGEKRGCLSTRTPHRPRPIGLSLGKILEVDVSKGEILVGGIDLVDGTPVLDVKPYVPWCDCVPEAFAPEWVAKATKDEPLTIAEVKFASKDTKEKVKEAYRERSGKDKKIGTHRKPLYDTPEDFLQFVVDTLSLDVRSTRERTAAVEDRKFDTYRVTLCDVEVAYVIRENMVVTIVDAVSVEPSESPGNADLDRPAITRDDNEKYFTDTS